MAEVFQGEQATNKVRLKYLEVEMQQVMYEWYTYRLK